MRIVSAPVDAETRERIAAWIEAFMQEDWPIEAWQLDVITTHMASDNKTKVKP